MALGDLITAPGQIEWLTCLLDATGFSEGVTAVIDPKGISGFFGPAMRTTRIDVPAGAGTFMGQDYHGPRTLGVPVIADQPIDRAKLLAAFNPRGPADEAEIAWCGFDWDPARIFRGFARPGAPGGIFDAEAARGGMLRPDLSWEWGDPYGYDLDPQISAALAPGATHIASSVGNWDSSRVKVTFNGPITSPGISTDAVDGGQILFPDLVLGTGQQIVTDHHLWTGQTLRSNHFTDRELAATALGAGPSATSPPYVFFPILPGTQTLTVHGTGAGNVVVQFYDAYSTPAAAAP